MVSIDKFDQVADVTSHAHDSILEAVRVLERALASPASGREEAWVSRVARDLIPVVAAVATHCEEAEAPGGLVRELELELGKNRLLTRVSLEHGRLANEAKRFLVSLEEPRNAYDIRSRAAALTKALRDHQAHEADLIYEAFVRDIGVGD